MGRLSQLGLGGYALRLLRAIGQAVGYLALKARDRSGSRYRLTDASGLRFRLVDRSGFIGNRKKFSFNADFEVVVGVQRRNATTGTWEDATGLADLAVRFSATKTGSALNDVAATLAERGAVSAPGEYFVIIDMGTMQGLSSYEDVSTFMIYSKAGDFDFHYVPCVPVAAVEI